MEQQEQVQLDSIVVNYSSSAVSSNIKVKGSNATGVGTESTLFITLNPLPANAGVISGLTSVFQGQNNVNLYRRYYCKCNFIFMDIA